MIAKAVKGKGFRGAVGYDLAKGVILETNMAGETPRQLATEFGHIRALRPNLGRAVLHVSLSAAPGEHLTDDQWRDIGNRYLNGMGLENNQYVMTRHQDTEHEHIHIVANRIRFDGTVTSDSNDYKRQEIIMREIERDYQLQRVAPSREAERRAPTKNEIEQTLRTGEPPIRERLQQLADAAARGATSYSQYHERLEAAGVELVPVAQLDGAKLSGLSYRIGNKIMKGSDLGKGYSPAGLAKRGVTYEQDRDYAAVRSSIKRDQIRAFGDPDRDNQASEIAERAGLGRDAGTAGPGDGRPSGRDENDLGRDRAAEPRADGAARPTDGRSSTDHQNDVNSGSDRSQQHDQSQRTDGMEALRTGRGDGIGYSDARERVLALAETSNRQESTGRGSGSGAPAPRDRSLEAIQRQIEALGVERYEIGIREGATGKMMNREWSRAEVVESVAWLKRMNAKGNDVYIRPAGDHGLIMVDDLTKDALQAMRAKGYEPAAVIETSPGNHQAWVKLADMPLTAEVRTRAAKGLAAAFGGDPNSADAWHYGRLAGFTNQKPKHTVNGKQPYVLAHDSPGKVATSAHAALQRIGEAMDKEAVEKTRTERLEGIKTADQNGGRYDPVREYQRQAQQLIVRYGKEPDFDLSKMDWMIAKSMAKSGRFSQSEIAKGIVEASPNVDTRKIGHLDDYAQRTARNAFADPDVMQHRQNHTQDRGYSR